MQVLTEKNSLLPEELEECKAQLEAALATAGEPKETPSGNSYFEKK